MTRGLNRLSARAVTAVKTVGMHADGGGLYLRVRGPAARSWIFVWHADGKRREMGLGAPPAVTLARARDRAQDAREVVADGGDPVALKRAKKAKPTFGELADAFIASRSEAVKSDKSIARWKRSIGPGGYADTIRTTLIDKVSTQQVVDVLAPIWATKTSTARMLRGYIEAVLNSGKALGHRSGQNPAAWTGHLALILPQPKRLTRGHHAAMPFAKVPDFVSKLKEQPTSAAQALRLTVLCATRTSETLGARWEEFDLDEKTWTIPAGRMKAGKEHRIPLSPQCLALLSELHGSEGLVFPGRVEGRPLSGMTMEMLLRRLGVSVTVHGFRSSFRDWAGEATDTPREVAEAALAHTVPNLSPTR